MAMFKYRTIDDKAEKSYISILQGQHKRGIVPVKMKVTSMGEPSLTIKIVASGWKHITETARDSYSIPLYS